MRLPGGGLHRHAVAQQLIGAQVGLIERDARGVRRSFQLLQSGGNMRLGVAPLLQVFPQQRSLDGAVVGALVPIPEVAVAEAVGSGLIREERDDAVLRAAFGSRLLRHGNLLAKPDVSFR